MTRDPDVVLRDVDDDDISALAELHVRTFRETHGGGPDAATREQQWRAKLGSGRLVFCIVLENQSGEFVGFASGEMHTAKALRRYSGELNKIYVLRKVQRRGLGRRLLCAAAERFIGAGVRSMLLFGDANSRSNGFYEAMGGERLYAATGEFHGGYGWTDLTTLISICVGTPRAFRA